MFDIGFLELFVIGVIALIVLGPERLPKAARTVGQWVGKAKQGFNSIKQEIDRELKVQELQQQLEEQKSKLQSQISLDSVKQSLADTKDTIDTVSDNINSSLTKSSASSQQPAKSKEND